MTLEIFSPVCTAEEFGAFGIVGTKSRRAVVVRARSSGGRSAIVHGHGD